MFDSDCPSYIGKLAENYDIGFKLLGNEKKYLWQVFSNNNLKYWKKIAVNKNYRKQEEEIKEKIEKPNKSGRTNNKMLLLERERKIQELEEQNEKEKKRLEKYKKKMLLEKAERDKLASDLLVQKKINNELENEKKKFELTKAINKEKKKLKKLQVMHANKKWYNEKDTENNEEVNEINDEVLKQKENLNKLYHEKKNLNQINYNENLSNYTQNLDVKGRNSKLLKPQIHNKNHQSIKSILKKDDGNKTSKNIQYINRVKVQEYDKKYSASDLVNNELYLTSLNESH
jgi:hypothetical protein